MADRFELRFQSKQLMLLTVSVLCRCSFIALPFFQCERLQPSLGLFGDNILRLFKPSTCRKIMCNTVTKKVMGFLPKSPLACRICQISANATTKGVKAIGNVFDVVLSDVSALCKDFNNTAVSKRVSLENHRARIFAKI